MSFKHILVHLDSSPHVETRLESAIAIAKEHGAFLRGLFAQQDRDASSIVARRKSKHFVEASQASEAMFLERTSKAGVASRWHGLEHGEYHHVLRETIIWSRFADLAIFSQHDRDYAEFSAPEELAEQVVLNSGRPILVIPLAGHFPHVGQRTVVAWNAEREAVRALNDAMPFLTRAHEVTVVTVLSVAAANAPHDDNRVTIDEQLKLHGVKAEMTHFPIADIGAMDALLNRAVDGGADLLVMGAHGHYTFPFLHRGSGTRHVLRTASMPVLFSH